MAPRITMLELVFSLSERLETDTEVVSAAARLVNRGLVRLCGNFAGSRIELASSGVERSARS